MYKIKVRERGDCIMNSKNQEKLNSGIYNGFTAPKDLTYITKFKIVMEEDVIGFIHTKNLAKKGRLKAGIAMYITKEKIMGAVKVKFGSIAAYLGEGSNVSLEYWEKAKKIKKLIEKRKEFELHQADIQSIQIKKPGVFRPGYVIFQSKNQEMQLAIGSDISDKEYNILYFLLNKFAPDKFQEIG